MNGGGRRSPAPGLWLSLGALALIGLGAVLAPLLAPAPPAAQDLDHRLQGPSWRHPFGQDELGRDILARLLYGARVSVAVALVVVLLAGAFGTLLGALAGYLGGWIESVCMRATDVVLAFPGILLAIALVAVLGPALRHVVLALVAIGWVGYARLVRGETLRLREQEYVLAARASGAGTGRILMHHVLPNLLPALLVQASLSMAGAILAEASLSFLGLGIQPPAPSWGAMINAGRGHLLDAPHLALFPGVAILVMVMSLNFLGDALIDHLDPRRSTVSPPTHR